MDQIALFIRHKTKPGQREAVRRIWERHMVPAVSANPGHIAYFYCFDATDEDAICAFQLYESDEARQAFLKDRRYQSYLEEVEALLAGPPQVSPLVLQWSKTFADAEPLTGSEDHAS